MNLKLHLNPGVDRRAAYPDHLRLLQSLEGYRAAHEQISRWPGFSPTPLVHLPALAAASGFASLHYKDEGGRFGLGSFKALGGAYAVLRLLQKEVARHLNLPPEQVSAQDLLAGRYRAIVQDITVTSATDGNHGRSVAWGAQMFGCRCVIYIHALVSEGRKAAIARYGADVVRTAGNYDDSVRQAEQDAQQFNRLVVSDTSYPGYQDVPKDVMQGYSVMAAEAMQQCVSPPTHIFVQGGVGGMAAAVLAYVWESALGERPRLIVVEPEKADCLYRSAEAGRPVVVHGDLDTLMAGLACGEVSLIAWGILKAGADAFMTIDDEKAVAAMRQLANPLGADPAVVAGESAVAGLAGAIAARAEPEMARKLGLDAQSRILVFGTEGATDPELYTQLVGRAPELVGRMQ